MPPKFVPRERKHKRLDKLKPASNSVTTDANVDIVLPASAAEREERRRKLQEELRAQQPQAKVSGKKRKRLDHYIDTKLRKEENQELIKKLANQHVDTSLYQSSKKLGRVSESKREGIERALKEREKGVNVRGDHDEILFEKRKIVDQPAHESEDDDEEDDSEPEVNTKPSTAVTQSKKVGPGGLFGGGLKTPLEMGEDGRPIIKKRKRVKRAKRESFRASSAAEDVEDEDMDDASEGPSEDHSDSEESDFRGFDSEPEEAEEEKESGDEEESGDEDSEDEEEVDVGDGCRDDSRRAISLLFYVV
jgi:ATP-dependent RNA helicase DHX37/DHR1